MKIPFCFYEQAGLYLKIYNVELRFHVKLNHLYITICAPNEQAIELKFKR